MVLCYGATNFDSVAALRLYDERFPRRTCLSWRVILDAVNRLRRSRSILPNRYDVGERRNARSECNEGRALDATEEDSTNSTRSPVQLVNLSKSTVHRMFQADGKHSYQYLQVQDLHEGDYAQPLEFCQWALRRKEAQPGFFFNTLFTDESNFDRTGTWNTHNFHYWANNNPNLVYKDQSVQ